MGRGQRFIREYLEVIPAFDPASTKQICRVSEIRGKGMVLLQLASGSTTLGILPPRFRGTLWLRRGALVIAAELAERDGVEKGQDDKVTLEIEHLLTGDDIKEFTKQGYIPDAFKRPAIESSSEEEEEEEEQQESDDCTDCSSSEEK